MAVLPKAWAPAGHELQQFSGTATRTVVAGDTNLSGVAAVAPAVTLADLTILASQLNKLLGTRHLAERRLQRHRRRGGRKSARGLCNFGRLFEQEYGGCARAVNTPLNVVGVAGGAGSVGGGRFLSRSLAVLVRVGWPWYASSPT